MNMTLIIHGCYTLKFVFLIPADLTCAHIHAQEITDNQLPTLYIFTWESVSSILVLRFMPKGQTLEHIRIAYQGKRMVEMN
jgi:hypothetical protein